MLKTYKCKRCPHTEEGNGPSVLKAHVREEHPEAARARKRRKAVEPEVETAPEGDAETALIVSCVDLFNAAGLDRFGDQRVLEYLAQRFGPVAYEGIEDEPAAEEEADES